jgi:hypothetical protein
MDAFGPSGCGGALSLFFGAYILLAVGRLVLKTGRG